jgi:hypothetical protein
LGGWIARQHSRKQNYLGERFVLVTLTVSAIGKKYSVKRLDTLLSFVYAGELADCIGQF